MIRDLIRIHRPMSALPEVLARIRDGRPPESQITIEQWLRRWLTATAVELRPTTLLLYTQQVNTYLIHSSAGIGSVSCVQPMSAPRLSRSPGRA